ncbi:MAG: hypothetical protein ABJE66_30440 [Deltaproteobacteria bacterium]
MLLFLPLAMLAPACKDKATPKPAAESDKLTGKDADARNALVLDAALDKAKKELVVLEAAQPRDEQAIAQKRQAIQAVQETLDRLNKRLGVEDRTQQPK